MNASDVRTVYRAPWGGLLYATTGLLVTVLLGVTVLAAGLLPSATPLAARMVAIWVGPVILGFTLPFMVRGYELGLGEVRVKRLGWTSTVSLMGLTGARVDPEAMRGSLRLLGNGGGFAFVGLYRSSALGMFRAWVNDPRRAVVLRFPGRTVVLSPDDPAEFVRALRATVPGLEEEGEPGAGGVRGGSR